MGVSGASTHMKRGRGGGTMCWPHRAYWLPPPLINRGHESLLTHTLVPPPFSPPAAPFHGRSLGEALTVGFFTSPRRRAARVPGSSTSVAPLDRGNRGLHRPERVINHGGTVGLRCTSSSS